jgi:hypothetical protein
MPEFEKAMIRALEKNIQRYDRLLHTKLTALERRYVKRRLAEDRSELRRLRGECYQPAAMAQLPEAPTATHAI